MALSKALRWIKGCDIFKSEEFSPLLRHIKTHNLFSVINTKCYNLMHLWNVYCLKQTFTVTSYDIYCVLTGTRYLHTYSHWNWNLGLPLCLDWGQSANETLHNPTTALILILRSSWAGRRLLVMDMDSLISRHSELVWNILRVLSSAANRLIGEVVQSWRRPLIGPSPGWKRLLPLSHSRHY